MDSRADAVERTRRAIVAAAMRLHEERGVRATSWEDIATEAGVATATVYRHFPSLTELVPACARTVFDIIRPPTVPEATAQFATLRTPDERLEALVRRSAHCYSAGAGWLHAAHRERDFVPELDEALAIIESALHNLVRAAAGRRLPKAAHVELYTLCDFPFWHALVAGGMSERTAEETIVRLVLARARASSSDQKGTR